MLDLSIYLCCVYISLRIIMAFYYYFFLSRCIYSISTQSITSALLLLVTYLTLVEQSNSFGGGIYSLYDEWLGSVLSGSLCYRSSS
jgi:hypothetical protein